MASIIDQKNYKLTIEKKDTIPSELKHLIFNKESFDDEGKTISKSKLELFISDSDIQRIKDIL